MEAHLGRMEAELRTWGVRLDKLIAKADAARTPAKVDDRERLDDLKEKYDAARAKLDELKAAGIAKWDLFQGVENAWSELETAFTRLSN